MIVMMMASTPSLNASRRLVRIAQGYQGRVLGLVPVAWRLWALPGQVPDQAVAGPQHRLGPVRVHRNRQQVALAELAAHPDEQLPFRLRLDPLGDHLELKGPCDPDDALDECEPAPG
jgi:hypothetical protein